MGSTETFALVGDSHLITRRLKMETAEETWFYWSFAIHMYVWRWNIAKEAGSQHKDDVQCTIIIVTFSAEHLSTYKERCSQRTPHFQSPALWPTLFQAPAGVEWHGAADWNFYKLLLDSTGRAPTAQLLNPYTPCSVGQEYSTRHRRRRAWGRLQISALVRRATNEHSGQGAPSSFLFTKTALQHKSDTVSGETAGRDYFLLQRQLEMTYSTRNLVFCVGVDLRRLQTEHESSHLLQTARTVLRRVPGVAKAVAQWVKKFTTVFYDCQKTLILIVIDTGSLSIPPRRGHQQCSHYRLLVQLTSHVQYKCRDFSRR